MKLKRILLPLCLTACLLLGGCGKQRQTEAHQMETTYRLLSSHEVAGRQGIAYENGCYYVSGSTTLTKYDKDWNVLRENTEPFTVGYEKEVNHIGDIDVYKGEIYCGVELFLDGEAKNIQIAIYDAETLTLKRAFPFDPESGQTECSGIAVNPDNGTVWMCSWEDGESGRYLYRYDLQTGAYKGKVHLHAVPQWIQGVAYHDGAFYLTADDGDADYNEPDHVYRTIIEEGATHCKVTEEKALDDVIKQGEIEGLCFTDDDRLLVLYNRGAHIVRGMPVGFYDGYEREIHEVFVYQIER